VTGADRALVELGVGQRIAGDEDLGQSHLVEVAFGGFGGDGFLELGLDDLELDVAAMDLLADLLVGGVQEPAVR
jgi:hypothetical protein